MPRRNTRKLARRETAPDWKTKTMLTGEPPAADAGVDPVEIWLFDEAEMETLWRENSGRLLAQWIKRHPGTRPWAWWKFDAPPMKEAPAVWWAASFAAQLKEPRQRLGGVGTPCHDALSIAPRFEYGLPVGGYVDQKTFDYYTGRAKYADPWMQGQYKNAGRTPASFPFEVYDPSNPPVYESEAAYLKRHGLLTKTEEKRLPPADFRPVKILPDGE